VVEALVCIVVKEGEGGVEESGEVCTDDGFGVGEFQCGDVENGECEFFGDSAGEWE
jgi:hypothetical protein